MTTFLFVTGFLVSFFPENALSFTTCVNDKGEMMITDGHCVAPYHDKNRPKSFLKKEVVEKETDTKLTERERKRKERKEEYEEKMENRRIRDMARSGEQDSQEGSQNSQYNPAQEEERQMQRLQRQMGIKTGQDQSMKGIIQDAFSKESIDKYGKELSKELKSRPRPMFRKRN